MEPFLHHPIRISRGWALRRSTPADFGGLDRQHDTDPTTAEKTPRRLLCHACKQPITTDDERIAIEGRHVHRRVNPMGIEFEFACFAAAPGAARLGDPTSEDSWFAGYAWSFALCGTCGSHLGWLFAGGDPNFYGLITNLLEEESEGPDGIN